MFRLPLLIAFLSVTALDGQPAPEPYKIGHGVSPPAVILKVDPSYSTEALEAGLQGTVILSLVVQTDGVATDLRVVRSLGRGLDEKAIEAVQKWRFRPGAKSGQSVPVFVTVEVNFRLPTSRPTGNVSTSADSLDANFRPSDVTWLEIKPGKYEVTTTTAWDIPLKPSELLSAFGPLDGLTPEQKAALDSGKPITTKTNMVCVTAGSLNRAHYIPETSDTSCKRTIVTSSSTKREMNLQCGPPGNATDLSVGFEAGAQDTFAASGRSTITRGTFKMDVTTASKAKWVATDCTDSN
jgi:TonB family protein